MSGEKNNNSTVLAFASAITSKINGLISSHNSNTSAHSDKESVSNKVTSWSSPTSNNKYASEKLVKDSLDNKQDTLVSGTSIKTINNESLLGSGNLTIESNSGSNVIDYYWDPTTEEVVLVYGSGGGSGGGGSIDIDSTWIANSTNPVESQLIQTALNAKQDTLVSGTSLKTINNQSLLGSGNITVLTSHQSLADCLQKSQTAGLVKNDGTIDENNYALASHNHSGTYANATHTHTQSQVTDLTLSSLGGVVTVEEQQTADTGFTKTYVIKQNGSQVGSKINIPKDFLVKSATVKTVTVANTPVNGYVSGDKYLDFIINSKDGTATDEHLYVLVSDLVDTEIDWSNVQNKPSIPSKTSDLNNDSGFITSSSVPSASSTTPSADTTAGSYGSGTSYARSNHTHPKSTLYAEASHTHSAYVNPTICDNLTTNDATQVLSAKQGKVLNDLVGQAISYINQ